MPRHSLNPTSILSLLCLFLATHVVITQAAPAAYDLAYKGPESSVNSSVGTTEYSTTTSSATQTSTTSTTFTTTESSTTSTSSSTSESSTTSTSSSASESSITFTTSTRSSDVAPYETVSTSSSSIVTPAPATTVTSFVKIPTPTTALRTTAKAAPTVSYAIAAQPVVTLQIVDGKLVTAGAARTAYSIAIPTPSGKTGAPIISLGADNGTHPALDYYLNPIVGDASEILSVVPLTCTKSCASFQSHVTNCAATYPPLLSSKISATTPASANETKTDAGLTACLCDYTYQAQSCGQCFAQNATLAAGPTMKYFQQIVASCQAAGENSTPSSLPTVTRTSFAAVKSTGVPTNVGLGMNADSPSAANNVTLQGVDKDLLAAICNGTGLANTDRKAFDSCKNGTNVAAILNTTDSALRQKLATLENKNSSSGNGTGESVDTYCNTVHFNDFFWSETCHKETGGAVAFALARGSLESVVAALSVLGAGVWLVL